MTQHDTWHDQLSAQDIYINVDKKELLTTALIKISSTHPQRDGSCCVVVVYIHKSETNKKYFFSPLIILCINLQKTIPDANCERMHDH